jgi:1-acyl-sn-glycerol-3-phosphate acyltransferase
VEALSAQVTMTMIKARHRPFYTWFFRIYSERMIRRHFRKVTIRGEFHDHGLPVLLIGNHFSWWDGFIANLLNTRVFHRKFHVMMMEEQLRHRMFLNKAGAYSIRKGNRSVLESIQYTIELLGKKENMVVLYPQGEFESVYQQPLKFENGLKNIASGVQNNFQLLFYVALVDYFSFRKPFLTIYLLDVPKDLALNPGVTESAYNAFLAECIMQQKPE